MKKKVRISDLIERGIIPAFTIATAFIWKDVILDFIKEIVPSNELLFYKFLTAVIATVIIGVIIYMILQTEYDSERIIKRIKKKKHK